MHRSLTLGTAEERILAPHGKKRAFAEAALSRAKEAAALARRIRLELLE